MVSSKIYQLSGFMISHIAGKKVHVRFFFLFFSIANMSNVFMSFLHKNSNGFLRRECCSPSEAKWESGETI